MDHRGLRPGRGAYVMQPAIRQYYRLEEIWGAKPVRLTSAAKEGAAAKKPVSRPPNAPPGQAGVGQGRGAQGR